MCALLLETRGEEKFRILRMWFSRKHKRICAKLHNGNVKIAKKDRVLTWRMTTNLTYRWVCSRDNLASRCRAAASVQWFCRIRSWRLALVCVRFRRRTECEWRGARTCLRLQPPTDTLSAGRRFLAIPHAHAAFFQSGSIKITPALANITWEQCHLATFRPK